MGHVRRSALLRHPKENRPSAAGNRKPYGVGVLTGPGPV
jgi:hypothetical protein